MGHDILLKLIKDDDLGLLDIKQLSSHQTSDERLLASFEEINDFIHETGNEPHANDKDMREFALYQRLAHFREDADKSKDLIEYDEFKLLSVKKAITSLEDIFNDDDLGILKGWSDSIFNIEHIPKESTQPDYVAQRKPCQNFDSYEYLFKQCQADLALGKRKLMPFAKEQQIDEGDFFVLKGILTFVAHVGEKEVNNGKKNARLYCVFENGTESDMLLRSLARELYKDGRRVTAHVDKLLDGFMNITEDDRESGYIYVLQSLSKKPEIQSIHNLYKIGFSRVPVEERIKNAAQEPTYLMDSVFPVASYRCFNLNPQKFELLIHTFFASACLNIDVFDREGQRHTPREWFIAPLEVIDQAIGLFLSRDIVNYRYDHMGQALVRK